MARKWSPNPVIVEAVEGVIARMSEEEKSKRVATVGFSKRLRAYTLVELLEEYKKGTAIGRAFEAVLISNTVERLKG